MRNFQDIFETLKRSFISAFSIYMTVTFLKFNPNHFLKTENFVQRGQQKFHEKQPFSEVLQNRCSLKFGNIHRKIPVLESLFNRVVLLWIMRNFKEHLQMAASVVTTLGDCLIVYALKFLTGCGVAKYVIIRKQYYSLIKLLKVQDAVFWQR